MRVHLTTLGCPKNQVDSELMLGLLTRAGFPLAARAEEADCLIVNTCAFIREAKEESVDTILNVADHKSSGNCKLLVVSGCLPQRYAGELAGLLPEVDALYGVPQRPEYHPEVDTGLHTEMVLDMAARLAPGDALIGFCALTHDLGKALTPADQLPRHVGHEHSGVRPLRAVCARFKVPAEFAAMAEIACREHLNVHRLHELRPDTLHDLVARADQRHPLRTVRAAAPRAVARANRAAAPACDPHPRLGRGVRHPSRHVRIRTDAAGRRNGSGQ